jgi:serine/threonine-protein kinase
MNQNKPAKKTQLKRDYKIISKLDAGGMGVVYKAIKKSTGETVALKILPPKFAKEAERLTRFNREIIACSRLDHPNLIRIIDNGCEDNLNFFTMEFFEGLSLGKMIKRDGPFSSERVVDVAMQIAGGCSYAHQKSLIHRDLKPDNILLNDDGLVKIIDFGLAKIRDITTMTRMDQALGTVRYLAPEILLGLPIDCRTDIYQMGLIFYELLTGKRVFTGNNPMALVRAYVFGGQPLSFFGFSVNDENWSNLLHNCLAVKADNRYSTSSLLIADLEKLKTGGKVELLTYT